MLLCGREASKETWGVGIHYFLLNQVKDLEWSSINNFEYLRSKVIHISTKWELMKNGTKGSYFAPLYSEALHPRADYAKWSTLFGFAAHFGIHPEPENSNTALTEAE